MAAGSPTCTGAPCTAGKREVTCTARTTCPAGMGRIDTTIGPWNTPAGVGGDRRDVHRHVRALLDVPHGKAGLDQRRLEGEAAADQERHEVVAPLGARCRSARRPARRAGRRGTSAASVRRSAPGRHADRLGRPRLDHLEQRAGLRVALAEEQEVEGRPRAAGHQVGLHEARRQAGGGRPVAAPKRAQLPGNRQRGGSGMTMRQGGRDAMAARDGVEAHRSRCVPRGIAASCRGTGLGYLRRRRSRHSCCDAWRDRGVTDGTSARRAVGRRSLRRCLIAPAGPGSAGPLAAQRQLLDRRPARPRPPHAHRRARSLTWRNIRRRRPSELRFHLYYNAWRNTPLHAGCARAALGRRRAGRASARTTGAGSTSRPSAWSAPAGPRRST